MNIVRWVSTLLAWLSGFATFYFLIIIGSHFFSFYLVRELELRPVLLNVSFFALALVGYFVFSFIVKVADRKIEHQETPALDNVQERDSEIER